MERKSYKIQGKTLTQGEMTLGQIKTLTAVLADVSESKSIMKVHTTKDMVLFLLECELIDRVLETILVGDKEGIVWDDLTGTELEALVHDFLAFNSEWIEKSNGLLAKSKI